MQDLHILQAFPNSSKRWEVYRMGVELQILPRGEDFFTEVILVIQTFFKTKNIIL